MAQLLLSTGSFAIVDDEDYPRVRGKAWCSDENGYVLRRQWLAPKTYQTVRLHHEILRVDGSVMIDHKNGNPLDNRKTNLRPCSDTQNQQNRSKRKAGFSRFKGVSRRLNRPSSWVARIRVNKQLIYLGSFSTEELAALAYDHAALRFFGEFARLNFPVETSV